MRGVSLNGVEVTPHEQTVKKLASLDIGLGSQYMCRVATFHGLHALG